MPSGYPPAGWVQTDKSTHPDSLICIVYGQTQTLQPNCRRSGVRLARGGVFERGIPDVVVAELSCDCHIPDQTFNYERES